MGTRGTFGFVVDGEEKLAYNHFDSYPSALGVDVLNWLRTADLAEVKAKAGAVRLVTDATPPTPEDVERLRKWANTGVSTTQLDEWYVLLRDTQGDPAAILEAGVMEDGGDFPLDSLFCEWGYVVDLDAGTFEVYRGFQTTPHTEGRFAAREVNERRANGGYHPIRLVASWPLTNLPTDKELTALARDEEDED